MRVICLFNIEFPHNMSLALAGLKSVDFMIRIWLNLKR